MLSVKILSYLLNAHCNYAEYAKCRYAECRGACISHGLLLQCVAYEEK
jgi:hypothetical protein